MLARLRGLVRHPVAVAVLVAFLARAWLIFRFPNNYAFDGWQRWAGRDHLLVQDWLPATQAVIYATAKLGGGVRVTRLVLAFLTALGVGAGTFTAGAIAGRPAAWVFACLAGFGPFLMWSGLLYQEGLFSAVFFAALALALRGGIGLSAVRQRGRPAQLLLAADVLFGLLCLVRYEGWPVALVYVVWRREVLGLRALWGITAWLLLKLAGVKGFYPSPVDYFEDWSGIRQRFDLHVWLAEVQSLGEFLLHSGGLIALVLGIAATGMCWRARGVPFIGLVLAGQIVATLCWVAGMENATQRMIVLPVVFALLPASLGVAEVWQRFPRARPVFSAALLAWVGFGLYAAADQVDRERERMRPEVVALGRMQACKECRWWIVPRSGLGSRRRDDGCEILQGMTRMTHGEEFWCAPWLKDLPEVEQAARQSQADGTVRWSAGDRGGGRYVVDFVRAK